MKTIRTAALILDEILDRIPRFRYLDGEWEIWRKGLWGCNFFRLDKIWDKGPVYWLDKPYG